MYLTIILLLAIVVIFYVKFMKKTQENININYSTCIVAISKNDSLYIDEWIRFNKKLGFDKIYIYDMNETVSLEYLEKKYKNFVIILKNKDYIDDIDVYNNFLKINKNKFNFVFFSEIDEFLVLKIHKNIKNLLYDYHKGGALAINILNFGSNDNNKYINNPVLKRFTKRGQISKFFKTIIYSEDTLGFENVFYPKLKKNKIINLNNESLDNADYFINNTEHIAVIHKYTIKSIEECNELTKNKKLDSKYCLNNDTNEILDKSAVTFYYGINSTPYKEVELVISRYNEPLDWLQYINHYDIDYITCYNKNITYQNSFINKIVDLPNVGKCDHSYVYHIVENYNNLADVTIFLPGSCDMSYKVEKTNLVINKALQTKNTVFYGNYINKNDLYDFYLKSYVTQNENNARINGSSLLKSCKPNKFGKWYEQVFGKYDIEFVSYKGIFAVSREHIQNRPLSFYQDLIKYIDDDFSPECGHYIERAWVSIFSPLPKSCLNTQLFID
jgi:hypothetical protein